ncbi:hypothetical protein [Dokdonella soli]|uniref:pilus assembly PilX family protein n=1 Tax=Dokdonella soli TaxID=529810 RepID=UPI0031DBA212
MLFVSLVILLMLSLFAITVADTAITQRKRADDARNRQLARLAADSALSEAKARISAAATAYGVAQVCVHLRCFVRAPGAPYDAAELMQTEQAKAAMNSFRLDLTKLDGADASARLAALPTYVIEDLGAPGASVGRSPSGSADPGRLFRITARGTGGRDEYVQVIEATYSVAR